MRGECKQYGVRKIKRTEIFNMLRKVNKTPSEETTVCTPVRDLIYSKLLMVQMSSSQL